MSGTTQPSTLRRVLAKTPALRQLTSAAYAAYLHARYGTHGVPRQVNGEWFRIGVSHRWRFPAVHDPEVADYLRSYIRPGMTCLNVGANVGIMTLQMARWSAPNGTVIAFEPNGLARAELSRHVVMNQLEDSVRIEPFAVSNENGLKPFFFSGDDGMGRLGEVNEGLRGHEQQVPVPLITLDEYCSSRSIVPDVIMMDIEGYEIEALEGARNLIRNNPKLEIVAEFHPSVWKRTKPDLQSLFRDLGLEPVPLAGQSDSYTAHAAVSFRRL